MSIPFGEAGSGGAIGATAGPGGSDSGWIASTSYTDSGLGPNENYCYRVYARDAFLNQTSPSAEDCDYTRANQPVLGSFSNITEKPQTGMASPSTRDIHAGFLRYTSHLRHRSH